MPPEARLKLRAEDAEDLAVISACLQDALVSVRDLAYDRDNRTFLFVASRFRWESSRGPAGDPPVYERIHCAVAFGEVGQVAYRGFRRNEEKRILSLLAIRSNPAERGAVVDLDFAAGATIRLTAGGIVCTAADVGEPWPTPWHPDHPLDERP